MKKLFFIACIFLFSQCRSTEEPGSDTKPVPAPQPVVDTKPALGIDISHYDGDIVDFINSKTDSLSFIICKATGGLTINDPMFAQNWKLVGEKKLYRGAYHFYYTSDDPLLQAAHYLKVTNNLQGSDFPPIVDFESGSLNVNKPVAQTLRDLKTFLVKVESVTKRIPIIYTGNDVGQTYFNDTAFTRYPLWIAYYDKTALQPEIPVAWQKNKWLMWQKSDSYRVESDVSDFDAFNGDITMLKAFLQK